MGTQRVVRRLNKHLLSYAPVWKIELQIHLGSKDRKVLVLDEGVQEKARRVVALVKEAEEMALRTSVLGEVMKEAPR